METQESQIVDLTSSPEVSPIVNRPANTRALTRDLAEDDASSPRRPLAPQPVVDTSPGGSSPDEWVDLSFMQRKTTSRAQPPIPPASLLEGLDVGEAALDPTDVEWRPSQQDPGPSSRQPPRGPQAAARAAAKSEGAGGRKATKRTREEIAAEAAEKKAAKAREAALRKEQRAYDSDKHVLKYLTVLLDPSLINTQMGIKIADAFLKTQTAAEHERITYKVAPTGIEGFPTIAWTRKIPIIGPSSTQGTSTAPGGGLGNTTSSSAFTTAPSSSVAYEERLEPHIMICFEAAAFVEAVQDDQLQSLWNQLSTKCSGHRVHLLVHRLDGHLTHRERGEFQTNMRAGAGSTGFRRGLIDSFVATLAVRRPGVTFRDVRVVDEAATHASVVTTAIAKSILKKSDADVYLLAKGKKDSANAAALLTNHPIEDFCTRTLMQSLCALPSVGPQIAHPIATRFQSLGALGDYLTDPSKSAAAKQKELENMQRLGATRAMRVGPKAAKQLVDLLTCEDPDLLVHEDTK